MKPKTPGKTFIEAYNELIVRLQPIYSHAEAREISRRLLDHVAGKPLTWVLAHPEAFLGLEKQKIWDKAEKRLIRHEPIQYVTTTAWFYGLPFVVRRGILIPRPETEELVEWIMDEFKDRRGVRFCDAGTGTGCIGVTLALHIDSIANAFDNSEECVSVASHNAERLEANIQFRWMDIFECQPSDYENLHFLVSNPPYVLDSELKEMSRNVKEYEPHAALFVPDYNALKYYIKLAELGQSWLKKGGWLYFEINEKKGAAMVEMLTEKGYHSIEVKKDIHGKDRFVRAQWGEISKEAQAMIEAEKAKNAADKAEIALREKYLREQEEEGHME
jgi:release factor glutamine methyltransferase